MIYDIEYYENMLRQYSKTAEQVSKIRWDWIRDINPDRVLDYGSGCGWFRAWRPKGVEVDSYDIGDYPQTGIDLIIYNVVCFWDVLEHISDFTEIEPVLALASHVAISLPLLPNTGITHWKHFKPGEHLNYFTDETWHALFYGYGFEPLKTGQPECPPREGITSMIYRKCNAC